MTAILQLSDGECRVLGTVRFNNIDGLNRPALKEAIQDLRHAERGDWRLVQGYQRNGTKEGPAVVAKKTGFVVFKDRSVVSFYTNDLADTPTKRIHSPDNHAVMCVHGLAPLHRWLSNESLRRTTLMVPAIVCAYNLFMNAVDQFDQFRSTCATLRKERRVSMSLLTFILDACIINAHALLTAISKPGEQIIDITIMKQRIIRQLVADYVLYQQQGASLRQIPAAKNITCSQSSRPHMLLETEGKRSVRCMMCRCLNNCEHAVYTIYSCSECQRGFHVNCFACFHNQEAFASVSPDVNEAVETKKKLSASKNHRNQKKKVTATLKTFKIINKTT